MFSRLSDTDLFWLIAAGVVFTGFLVYTVRQILRADSHVEQIVDEEITEPMELSVAPKVAAAFRKKLESGEAIWLIQLTAAMVGYGPSVSDSAIREGAAKVMGDRTYQMFSRQFAIVAHVPKGILMHPAPIDELSFYSMDNLLTDDDLLTLLVTYARSIDRFFAVHKDNPNLPQMLESDEFSPQKTIVRLLALHGDFYAS